jgi:hypothetical protein
VTSPAVESARPLADLRSEVFGTIEPLRRVCDYVQLGQLLPSAIDELHWHIAQARDEASQRVALESLVEACVIAAAVTKELNYMDLAYLAAMQAKEAADVLSDPRAARQGRLHVAGSHCHVSARGIGASLRPRKRPTSSSHTRPHRSDAKCWAC